MISFERLTVIHPATGAPTHASVCKVHLSPHIKRFRWYTDEGLSYEVARTEEGTTWLRGHLPFDAEEVKAMQAAFVLGDDEWRAPVIRGL